jgi:hypothetical protein
MFLLVRALYLIAKFAQTCRNRAVNMKLVAPHFKIVLAFMLGAAWSGFTCSNTFGQTVSPATHLPQNVQTMLENADTFTLFSLNPDPDIRHQAKEDFQDYEILGQLNIPSRATRTKLIDALNEGIAASDQTANMCFNPRHGIRAKKGNETVELLICFECRQIEITSPWVTNTLLTTPDPWPTFNKVLKTAGIPLPKN